MRFARKLVLLALAAVAAMALAATPASATDAIEVVDADGHCASLASGGCNVHATGTVKLEVNFFGFWTEEDTCDIELDMRVDSNGNGEVYGLDHYATETGTSVTECETETPVTMCSAPWETQRAAEESANSVVHAVVAVCIDSDESDICGSDLEFDIEKQGGNNFYSVEFANSTIGSLCRINGTLAIESAQAGNSDIQINHL